MEAFIVRLKTRVQDENNRLLKINQDITNYQMLAHQLKMLYDEYGDYRHFAFEPVEEKVKEEIKCQQVIKAGQRIKKMNGQYDKTSELI